MNETPRQLSVNSPTLHLTIGVLLTAFITMIVVSIVMRVEVVAIGTGKVIPVSRVQVIQPEFSSKIISIPIRNGDSVQKGDLLIEFDKIEALADKRNLIEEASRLDVELRRLHRYLTALEASPDLPDIEFELHDFSDTEVAKTKYWMSQRSLLSAELIALKASINETRLSEQSAHAGAKVIQAKKDSIEAALALAQERLEITNALRSNGHSSRVLQLESEEVVTTLVQDLLVIEEEIKNQSLAIESLKASFSSQLAQQVQSTRIRVSEISERLSEIDERLVVANRILQASELRAPMAGTINELNLFTIGGVVEAGQEVMRVVPEDAKFEIEAVLTNTDIGFVENGQTVNIKFDAYPSERFGHMKGTVMSVSADTSEVANDIWGYTVNIRPDSHELISGNLTNEIRSGMTAEVNIITEKRRLITYFFAPIVKTISSALGER